MYLIQDEIHSVVYIIFWAKAVSTPTIFFIRHSSTRFYNWILMKLALLSNAKSNIIEVNANR